mgnify:CR=1 FL=1
MDTYDLVSKHPLLAILRNVPLEKTIDYAEAAVQGGAPFFEVALNSPHALEQITMLRPHFGDRCTVGAGTAITVERCKAALDAGAQFLLTPGTPLDVFSYCAENDIALLPGVLTPTDVATSLQFGYKTMKLLAAGEELTELTIDEILHKYRSAQDKFLTESFGTIAAYGTNAAMMHYHATEEDHAKLEKKGFLLVDSGATYMDGTTDITRTYPLGELTEDERLFYTWTLQCHIDIARAVWLDYCDGHMLDTIAREPLWRHLINYRCGTGHSVSFVGNVHEGPHALNGRNTTLMRPGMIVTDEPGVYEAGEVGIRIENEIECYHKADNQYGTFLAFRPLTFVPIATSPIVPGVLDKEQVAWLNDYHRKVFEQLAPRLTEDERDWLAKKCAAIGA